MIYKHTICWIRRDLRLRDHVALAEATRQSQHVTVVFVFDTTILSRLIDKDDKRITFIMESLKECDATLRQKGSALVVLHGDPVLEIPKLAKKLNVDVVFTNHDYEPKAKKRDQKVKNTLEKAHIQFHSFKDQVIFEGLEVKTGGGDPYKVFTPYKNMWLSQLTPDHYKNYSVPLKKTSPIKILKDVLKPWDYKKIGFKKSDLWLDPGEKAGGRRLNKFAKNMDAYHEARNFPARDNGTSGLSVHLRFGTVSIRQLVRFAKEFRSQGSRTWLSELVWRDFYQMILDQFPYVEKGCFKKKYDSIKWPGKNEHFEAWKEGQTGYPLVDAAMRHFNETGWMHNRLRMVVASFLTKDLLVSWKKGEAWFAQKLLDFDLAANNGGWQWSASVGCDAQPYFRIFNPHSQTAKFDPEGKFIRSVLGEMKKSPKPIVDHATQRIKAMGLFKILT